MSDVMMFMGGGGMTPAIAGAYLWYDFSDIATLWQDTARTSPITADGQGIQGVTNKGSAANHLSEAATPPLYSTSPTVSFSGRSVASFPNGANKRIGTGSTFVTYGNGTNSGACTTMVVMCHTVAFGAEGGAWNPTRTLVYHNNAGAAVGYYLAGSSFIGDCYINQWATSGSAIIARKAATINVVNIYTGIAYGNGVANPSWRGDTNAGVNDTRTASLTNANATGSSSIPAASTWYLGGNVPSNSYYWSGYVAEVAYWNSVLDEATRKLVERTWAGKYGVTLPY